MRTLVILGRLNLKDVLGENSESCCLRTPTAVKKRNQRKRQRGGLKGYRLYLPEASVVEALIAVYGLTEAQALDHAEQERGLERHYLEWLRRWRRV